MRLFPPGSIPTTKGELNGPSIRAWTIGLSASAAIAAALTAAYLLASRPLQGGAIMAAALLLLGAAIGLLGYRLALNFERARSDAAAAAAAVKAVAADRDAQIALLRAAVDNMSQGLCMYGPDRRLIMSNARYAELYGIPQHSVRSGMSIAQILATRIAAGNIPVMGQVEFIERMAKLANEGVPAETVIEQTDGRVFLLGYMPLANGGWVATHQDITDRQLAEAKIAHMARHDALTNLPNRASFRERLEQALARVDRGENLAVLCLDLDRFKGINDTLGHHFGDLLLLEVANRLKSCVREMDTVARLSGDEFAILQVGIGQPADVTVLAQRIVESIAVPCDLEGHQVAVGASVGITIAPGDGADPDRLLKNADMALYRAKADGRGTYRFFEPEMDARMQARRALEADIRRAIVEREFALHYQSIVNLKTGQIGSFEALLRWKHPLRGIVAPADFVPIAEETGVIVPLGEWVIRQACKDAAAWPEHIKVSVNLSAIQLRSGNLVAAVAAALSNSGLTPGRLELEITETVMILDSEATLAMLHKLRALGVHIAMDDFGTGYSSLSYLRNFPFNKIKIDRSFIQDMGEDKETLAIIRAVSALGKSLGMATTAEGVETSEQLERVRTEGYTEVQGYFFSRPRPAEEVTQLLANSVSNILAVA